MAYTSWGFTATQVLGYPQNVVITSVTTGTDASVVKRRAYISDSAGNFLVPTGVTTEYNEWVVGTNPETLDILTEDTAVKIVLQWLDVSDNILYDSTQSAVGFVLFNEQFDYTNTQLIAANPKLTGDNGFMASKYLFRTYMDSGNQAITLASDLVNAQLCYDQATEMRINAQYVFNQNS